MAPIRGVAFPSVTTGFTRVRRAIRPPAGCVGWFSRRQAAAELGLPSDFKLRELEKRGRLHPVRGAMGAAFYPPAEVLALKVALGAPAVPGPPRRHWSDAELVALLRERTPDGRARSVVDLVVDAGIDIARAERVFRFWASRDVPARVAREVPRLPAPAVAAVVAASPHERRSPTRIDHAALLSRLRDPDPRVRAEAFAKLRSARP